jgi:predicted DNA-binding protein (UPF0251 family)
VGRGAFFYISYYYLYQGIYQAMPRPRLNRYVRFNPQVTFYKPQGIPMRYLDIVELSLEEAEALRLKNIEKLDQTTCAKNMCTCQSTFQRILARAYNKISDAIINGKAIKINKEV